MGTSGVLVFDVLHVEWNRIGCEGCVAGGRGSHALNGSDLG